MSRIVFNSIIIVVCLLAIITIAITGLNCGSIKNAALPATAKAHKTLITITSRARGFLDSNTIQKGIIVSIIISRLIK